MQLLDRSDHIRNVVAKLRHDNEAFVEPEEDQEQRGDPNVAEWKYKGEPFTALTSTKNLQFWTNVEHNGSDKESV